MDVHVGFLEQANVDAEATGTGLYQGQRRLRALLHDVAELAGEDEPAAPRHTRRLDEQDIAAGRRPGEARCDTRHAGAHGDLVFEAPGPENGGERRDVDAHT